MQDTIYSSNEKKASGDLTKISGMDLTSFFDIRIQQNESVFWDMKKKPDIAVRLLRCMVYWPGLKLSFKETERLKTGAPGLESLESAQK